MKEQCTRVKTESVCVLRGRDEVSNIIDQEYILDIYLHLNFAPLILCYIEKVSQRVKGHSSRESMLIPASLEVLTLINDVAEFIRRRQTM